MGCTTGHHEVKGSSTKKQKITYHNLKKIVRAQHNHIFTLSVEHKHHMSNEKEHHRLHHRYGEEAMLITNVDSTFNMACQQVKLVSSGNHKLTYHMLKK
jgi:molybdenum cofactor biosynthesis enzyme MoaA